MTAVQLSRPEHAAHERSVLAVQILEQPGVATAVAAALADQAGVKP